MFVVANNCFKAACIPQMPQWLRMMPVRGFDRAVLLRCCALRHAARTGGRRRQGRARFPFGSGV